jgi:hypothetical protein
VQGRREDPYERRKRAVKSPSVCRRVSRRLLGTSCGDPEAGTNRGAISPNRPLDGSLANLADAKPRPVQHAPKRADDGSRAPVDRRSRMADASSEQAQAAGGRLPRPLRRAQQPLSRSGGMPPNHGYRLH